MERGGEGKSSSPQCSLTVDATDKPPCDLPNYNRKLALFSLHATLSHNLQLPMALHIIMKLKRTFTFT